MDAVNFIKTINRMCEYYNQCDEPGCPLKSSELNCNELSGMVNDEEKIVSRVEKWNKEHPVKTRQSEFLKLFPHANLEKDGILKVFPCNLDKNYNSKCENKDGDSYITCENCRKEYWTKEI